MWLYCTGSSSPSATNPRWSSSLNASASGRQKNKTTNALKIALPLPTDFWDKLLLYAGYVYWVQWECSSFILKFTKIEQYNCWTIVLVLWQEAKIILFTLSLKRALKICQKLLNIDKICDSNWYTLLVL